MMSSLRGSPDEIRMDAFNASRENAKKAYLDQWKNEKKQKDENKIGKRKVNYL